MRNPFKKTAIEVDLLHLADAKTGLAVSIFTGTVNDLHEANDHYLDVKTVSDARIAHHANRAQQAEAAIFANQAVIAKINAIFT